MALHIAPGGSPRKHRRAPGDHEGPAMSGSGSGTNGPAARRKRQPLKATPERLERSALYYLERYDSSSGHLRRLLRRKVALSARVHGTDAEEGRAAVDRVIARSEEHTSELQSLMRTSY